MNIIANDIDKKGKKRKSKKIQGGICLFPFKYKGINYNDCVNGESGIWCATSLTKKGSVDKWGFCDNQQGFPIQEEKNDSDSNELKDLMNNYYIQIKKDGIIRHYKNNQNYKTWSIGFTRNKNDWILELKWGKLHEKQRKIFNINIDIKKAQKKINSKLLEGYQPVGVSFYFDPDLLIDSTSYDIENVKRYVYQLKNKKTKKNKKNNS